VFLRAGPELSGALELLGAEVVTTGAEPCDLAVAEHPDSDWLAQSAAALEPGGVCYTEWPRGADARAITLALERAGYTGVCCYRPWPEPPALPVYWIPADSPACEAYVRARQRARRGMMQRLLLAVGESLPRALPASRRPPLYAVARRPGPPDADAAAALAGHAWERWDLRPEPGRLSTMLITGGPRTISKVVVLAFREPAAAPIVAVKAARVEPAAVGVRREAEVLKEVERRHPGLSGVPRVLFSREARGTPLVGETAIAGQLLETRLRSRTLSRWAHRVTDWLIDFAADGVVRPAAHWRRELLGPVVTEFKQAFAGIADPALVSAAEAVLERLPDLPSVIEQRDFSPWNLLVTPSGELGVLDWESAAVDGLPLLDLLYFLAHATFNVDRALSLPARLVSYRRALDPSSATGALRSECIRRYVAALGLNPACVAPLRVLVWMIHAQSEVRHAAADAGGVPGAAALSRSLFLALWQEEVGHVTRG
jgi:hypothetical protein